MTKINVGDWVEVVEVTDRETQLGVKVGDKYEVLNLNSSVGVFIKPEDCSFLVEMHIREVKKVDAPTAESSEIKAGDWVEVTKILATDGSRGIRVGDTFKVIKGSDGSLAIVKMHFGQWIMLKSNVKKVERPQQGEVASTAKEEHASSDIKAGDWVKVVKLDEDGDDEIVNMSVGDVLLVLYAVDSGGGIKVKLKDGDAWWISPGQFEKADAPSVNEERPASTHYQNTNGNDVWQFAEDNLSTERVKGFHQINAIKYITRYHKKHSDVDKRIEDLRKAKVYVDKLIELEVGE